MFTIVIGNNLIAEMKVHDLAVAIGNESFESEEKILNTDFMTLSDYYNKWRLITNQAKTELLLSKHTQQRIGKLFKRYQAKI